MRREGALGVNRAQDAVDQAVIQGRNLHRNFKEIDRAGKI